MLPELDILLEKVVEPVPVILLPSDEPWIVKSLVLEIPLVADIFVTVRDPELVTLVALIFVEVRSPVTFIVP